MKIKTLADILAESESDSASSIETKQKKPVKPSYQGTSKKSGKPNKRAVNANKDSSSIHDSTTDLTVVDASSPNTKKGADARLRQSRY